MARLQVFRGWVAIALFAVTFGHTPPVGARVVLFGVDGGSWNLLDAGIRDGSLPNLRALRDEGVHARLATVEPVNSPTVWTTVATGRRPDSHGVTGFFATSASLRVPTTWERLARRGVRVGLYDYLVTWPPTAISNGFVIPGWLRRNDDLHPPDVFERAELAPYAYSMDGVRAPQEFVENNRRELSEKPGRFAALIRAFELDLAVVTFYAMDAASHRFWQAAFPGEFGDDVPKSDPRFAGAISETLAGVDRALGVVRAALGPEDSIVVISDHGFRAVGKIRRVWETHAHEWMERAGFDLEQEPVTVSGGFAIVAVRIHPGPFAARDAKLEHFRRVLESARNGAGAPLFRVFIFDVAPRPKAAERSLIERAKQRIVERILAWYQIRLEEPAHAYLVAVPNDDTLNALWPDGRVDLDGVDVAIRDLAHPNDFTGGHDPTGIFLAAGPAIRKLPDRTDLSVLDVSPLLYYLTGQPIPDDLEGALPVEILDPNALATRPTTHLPAREMPGLERHDEPDTDASNPEVEERLRSLGYVE